jgi:monofunctional biosynthetic peptidoglycan transglycosylase
MKKFWKIFKAVFIRLFIFHLVYTLLIWLVNPPITLTMLGSLITGDGLKRNYVSFNQISKNARLAVIASEDQLFPEHFGFDLKGIQAAMEFNENQTGKLRGGSTISQQVAKNVFLWQGRSYFRKGLEAYCTLWIELLYSKKRILELYLNIAEMGKGVYGIEAAAQYYFKKSANQLTAREAAAIAACLPSPKKFSASRPSGYVNRRINWIQKQMRHLEGDPNIRSIIAGNE